ncbi:class I SAM-dependent methyltransferase [Estrella lausannensis]|uniref:S-adenosylmethionine-dependent methyltransferase domain-containing protein n=1 Tax=Estrella lausannensis TaxID=483423 RepID=A0A0H5DQE2_9BACT|nr:class I SAM-dependent methyltransferase [Estrella lausannensis]CRX38737.1 hypothetical protein ELAC_1401 [Estrella lausannensis]
MDYRFLDSGNGYKLERFGKYTLARPSGIAIWKRTLSDKEWKEADAGFSRERENRWDWRGKSPLEWQVELSGIKMKCQATDFGHLGVFPEHASFWAWMQERAAAFEKRVKRPLNALNLFAYSGGATLALAKAGCSVCHVDSSKGMVDWARENAHINDLGAASIRWIVEDALKFMQREVRRGKFYDAIILDPPSFGRGSKGEVFKIEEHVMPLLEAAKSLMSKEADFILFSCHTPGFTPIVMDNLLQDALKSKKGLIDSGEMILQSDKGMPLPSGSFGRWRFD